MPVGLSPRGGSDNAMQSKSVAISASPSETIASEKRMPQSLCHARIEKRVRVILRKSNTTGRHQEITKEVSLKLGCSNRYRVSLKKDTLSRGQSSRKHLRSSSSSPRSSCRSRPRSYDYRPIG